MVKVYRKHVTVAIILVCAIALMILMISFLASNLPTTTRNVDTDRLMPNMVSSGHLRYDDGADRIEITLEYFTEEEFDVWLVDDADWDIMNSLFSPGPWLRHGVAGAGVIEWSVSADEFQGNLLLVEENSFYGNRGSFFNSSTIHYDWEITTRSIVNPMTSPATWVMIGLVVLAAVLLAWQYFLPHETFQDFRELYPDFPDSVEVVEVEPEGS